MSCNISYDNLIFSIHKLSKNEKINDYYVFIGKTDENIKKILNKLENRLNIPKEEVLLLKNNYKDYYLDWISIVKKKIRIKFIPVKIEIDDSINEIRKKIFVYLSDEKNKYFILPQNQELWLQHLDGKMEIIGYYYYKNTKTEEKEYITPSIYEEFSENFDEKAVKKNTSENNMLIYDLLENSTFKKHVIYLCNAKDEEEYLKSKKIAITDRVINKYFKKYWPYINLNYNYNEIKNEFILLQDSCKKEDYIFELINDHKNNKKNFGSCNILTAKIETINTGTDINNIVLNEEIYDKYIDLYPIFDYIRENVISENTPFMKYYENILESPFSIISKEAINKNIISQKTLREWLNLNPDSYHKKINDIIIKRFLKVYNNENRFYHISLNRFGIVKINISFDNVNNATFYDINNAINDCKDFINNINKNRVTKKKNELKKIESPHMEIVNNKIIFDKNTKIIFMNVIIPIKLDKEIDFKKLLDFSKKFPNFITEAKEGEYFNEKIEKSVHLRYKRVSGYANMNDILIEIDKLKSLERDTSTIIKIIEKKYQKNIEEIKKYLLEWERKYSSSKSKKISSKLKKGMLVKIGIDNILINGITKVYQIPLLYNFFTTFLTLFSNYDNFLRNKIFKNIFNKNTKFYENNYEVNTSAKININYNLDYDYEYDYDYDEDLLEDDYKELINEKNELNNLDLASNDEIDPNIKLNCDDAIPEKQTCKDFCNDSGYFLRRLQMYDNALFRIKNEKKNKHVEQYSRKCAKQNQPVVLGYDPAKNDKIKKDSYSYSVKYSSDPDLKQRWYMCPKIWCPICEIPILEKDIDPKSFRTRKTADNSSMCKTALCPYGDHQVFIRDNDNAIYPGFLSKSSHPQGLCMPCCFKNPHNNPKSGFYVKFKKCIGDEIENEISKNGQIYILGKGIPIQNDRYGRLSIEVARILNTNLETGYLGYKSGYLRKGIKHVKNNSFLCCISDILSCDKNNKKIDLSKIKNILVEKLNDEIFRSIFAGNLPNVFHNPSEKFNPLENFKKYLFNEKIEITHRYLWDYLQRNNILFENGINIFIFENNNLLCPKEENINNFYDINKKSILIVKSGIYYEPVYFLEGNGKIAIKTCIFTNNSEEIKKLFEIARNGCKNEDLVDWILLLKDNIKKYDLNIDNLSISNGENLQTVLNELLINIKNKKLSNNYIPNLQYIDSYNKVFGLLLKNGLYIPIAPSKLFDKIKYKNIFDFNDIHKIDFNNALNYTNEICLKTNLKIKITHKILDLKDKKNIIALVNENNRFIPIKPIKNNDNKLKISNINFYSDVDEALYDKIEKIDNRIEIMNKKNFEDETFIRLKFELSKFIQIKDNKQYLKDILDIINSPEKNISIKRTQMLIVLNKIYSKLVVIKNIKNNYYDYKTPNKRVPCFLKTSKNKNKNFKLTCENDPHCIDDKGNCKLFINENNLLNKNNKINNYSYYLSKIIDELLRYKMKRNEILDDNISSIINKELVEKNKKYIIIHTMNYNELNNIVDKLYLDNKGIHIDTRDLYEENTTKEIGFKKDTYLKSNMILIQDDNKIEDLSIYWNKFLGNKFKVKTNDVNQIFPIFALILNLNEFKNNKNELITINIIKSKIINYYKNLNQEKIINIYKNSSDKIFKYITSYEGLIDEILSENYNGSEVELEFISKIFNINIVVLDKRVKKNIIPYRVFKSNIKTDYFIILYSSFHISNNIYNIIYQKIKLLFKLNELPSRFVENIIEK